VFNDLVNRRLVDITDIGTTLNTARNHIYCSGLNVEFANSCNGSFRTVLRRLLQLKNKFACSRERICSFTH
jgi:hypothetical protein